MGIPIELYNLSLFKKKCKGYTGYIFTGNMDLAKKIGLRASRRLEFYTAKIDCRLLEYELYAGKISAIFYPGIVLPHLQIPLCLRAYQY